MTTRIITADVVEAFRLGNVTVEIVRHRIDDRSRLTVRFFPTGVEGQPALGFQQDELMDLADAVCEAESLVRNLGAGPA